MGTALTIVVLLTCVVALAALARRLGVSAPIVLIVFGFLGSYAPFIPDVELTPEVVLVGLLPPLLYAAAIRMSLIDFRFNRRPIMLLSVGLVIVTTLVVGLVVHWMLDVQLPAALALGAVVAPPDAVAATSIARRVGLPRRVVTILEGESLVNDATALVALRMSIVAIGGSVTLWEVGLDFAVSAFGGVAVGLAVALVVGRIRRRVDDDLTDVALSLLTPWIAYLPAEEIGASGVLALVIAGLVLGHKSPVIQSATSRIFERTNWSTISFLLENAVFLLIGLQVRGIVADLGSSELTYPTIALTCVVTLLAVVLVRFVWMFPATYLPRLIPSVARADPAPGWRVVVVISWAGMRGVVTLAAVFTLPKATPYREVFVAVAFFVTAATLLLQGLTLPLLVRMLGLHGPDLHEDYLQEATVYQRAARAGLDRLDDLLTGDEPEEVVDRLRTRSLDRANAVWERLGGDQEPPSAQYSRLRSEMLRSERDEVLRIRTSGKIDQAVLQQVLDTLDVEETVIDRVTRANTADRETDLAATGALVCEHLEAYRAVPSPRTPKGCEECLREGLGWVHLRLCMACGHVGCCNSSVGKHAERHWDATQHPVMRSLESGEAWRWCFADELTA